MWGVGGGAGVGLGGGGAGGGVSVCVWGLGWVCVCGWVYSSVSLLSRANSVFPMILLPAVRENCLDCAFKVNSS